MISPYKQLTLRMKEDALSPRYRPLLMAAHARQSTLERYQSVEEILRVLKCERKDLWTLRNALTRAVLEEHRRQPSARLWSTILIVAYYPMLSRLRFRTYNERVTRDDLDQLVILAFLRALERVPIDRRPHRLALQLRQYTASHLFRLVRSHCRSDVIVTEEEFEIFDAPERAMVVRDDLHEWEMMLGDMRRRLGERLEENAISTLAATIVGEEELEPFVHRKMRGTAVELERAYQRLKRQRTRALKHLRLRISPSDELFERSA